jgi:F-type H+-transporting ATPase subunit b
MFLLALQSVGASDRPAGEILRTFGVDWLHLGAQTVSFLIVCAVMYRYAYTPILAMLEARREQIASGLANAAQIKAQLARIETERLAILAKAGDEGRQLVEDARTAAARVQTEDTQKAVAMAADIVSRGHEAAERERVQVMADVKREVGRLVVQTTASVTGKILTAEDHRRLAEETARQIAM